MNSFDIPDDFFLLRVLLHLLWGSKKYLKKKTQNQTNNQTHVAQEIRSTAAIAINWTRKSSILIGWQFKIVGESAFFFYWVPICPAFRAV